MKIELSELAFVIVAGTLLFVFLIFIIIAFFMIYQKRKTKVESERKLERENFEKEILNTQSEIREETMRFIAQELHDNIAQTLTVATLSLNQIDDNTTAVSNTKESLKHTIEQVKLLSKALNTENVIEDGFLKSFTFEIERLKKLNRWNIDFFNEIEFMIITKEKQVLLFRIFQELISNFIKYSQADSIVIELDEDTINYFLTLTDDGNQYDFIANSNSSGHESGMGLRGIIRRIEILKGKIEAIKNLKKGMEIKITIPKIQ